MPKTISSSLPTKLELATKIQCVDGEENSLPKINIVGNTGEPMMPSGFDYPVIVDLSGVSFAFDSIPILMDHSRDRRIGHTTKNKLTKKEISFEGVASSSMNVAKGFVEDSKNGFPFQSSIGADIIENSLEFIEQKAKVSVNGRVYKGPLYVARKTSVYEVSVTVFGADSKTKAIAATKDQGEKNMNKFQLWLQKKGFEEESLSEEQKKFLKATFDNEQSSDPPPLPTKKKEENIAATNTKLAENEKRVDGIRAVADQPRFEAAKVADLKIDGVTTLAELKAYAIQEGWDADKMELYLHRVTKPKHVSTFGAAQKQFEQDNINDVLTCATLKSNLGTIVSGKGTNRQTGIEDIYKPEVLEASDSYKNLTLHSLMDMQLRAAGKSYEGSRKDSGYIRAVQEAVRTIQATGVTTVSLTNILENVQNKTLMAAYNAVEVVWDQLCAVRNLNDFKAHAFYRLETTGAFKKIAPDGELKHIGLTDSKETVTADTYGAIIALTRQMVINDDLDAFMQIGSDIGRLAALRIEELVFSTLLSNPSSFFHANNGNLKTGAGSDLGIAGLTLGSQTFDDFVDSNGKPIGVSPDRIFVGTQDIIEADRLYNESKIETTTTADTPTFTNNPHSGRFRPVKARYLNNTNITNDQGEAITGQDSNQWYIGCDPNQLAGMRIGFLNGVRQPTVEQDDLAFNMLGFQWRAYFDFGVGMGNVKALVKMAGT